VSATSSSPSPDAVRPERAEQEGDQPQRSLGRRLVERSVTFQPTWILVSLISLMVVFSVLRPGEFLTSFNLTSIASDAAVLLVLSIGQTFVIITAGIDLSVGSVLVFSGVIAAELMGHHGGASGGVGTMLLGLAGALAGGVAWGLINGLLIAKARIPALIATLGTFGMSLGFAQIITRGVDLRSVPTQLSTSIGFGKLGPVPWIVLITVAIAIVAGFLLHTTRFGLRTFAIGSNAMAARKVAIPVDRHLIRVYALSGFCAGIAGYLSLARFSTTTISGHSTDNLATITAVVLGGASLFGGSGMIFGTVIGVLIPVVLANGLVITGVQPFWQSVAIGAVLILAVYIDQLRHSTRER
jgi:ribose transport system permease protein